MFEKIVNFYKTNSKFHSFVVAVESGLVSGLTSLVGGVPVNKAGWVAIAATVGGAVWGAAKRWATNNVLTPEQAAEVSQGLPPSPTIIPAPVKQ